MAAVAKRTSGATAPTAGWFNPPRRGAWLSVSPSSCSQERWAPTADARLAGWRATATLRPSKGADKNLGSIFFSARLWTGERLETREGGSLGTKDRPLKQPAISLRPGSYVHEGVALRGVADRLRDLWCLFTAATFFVFPSTFFSC